MEKNEFSLIRKAILTVSGVAAIASMAPEGVSASAPEQPRFCSKIVQPGDTISGIAANFGLNTLRILELNPNIRDPSMIHAGDEILLPFAVCQEGRGGQWNEKDVSWAKELTQNLGFSDEDFEMPGYRLGSRHLDENEQSKIKENVAKFILGAKQMGVPTRRIEMVIKTVTVTGISGILSFAYGSRIALSTDDAAGHEAGHEILGFYPTVGQTESIAFIADIRTQGLEPMADQWEFSGCGNGGLGDFDYDGGAKAFLEAEQRLANLKGFYPNGGLVGAMARAYDGYVGNSSRRQGTIIPEKTLYQSVAREFRVNPAQVKNIMTGYSALECPWPK